MNIGKLITIYNLINYIEENDIDILLNDWNIDNFELSNLKSLC